MGNVLLVTWQITNVISGTMQMAFDYQPQSWHGVCFYLVSLALGDHGGGKKRKGGMLIDRE